MDLGLVGRAATAAIELRGQFVIAGVLRTAPGFAALEFNCWQVERQLSKDYQAKATAGCWMLMETC